MSPESSLESRSPEIHPVILEEINRQEKAEGTGSGTASEESSESSEYSETHLEKAKKLFLDRYGKSCVNEIRSILSKMKLSTEGKKPLLLQRLFESTKADYMNKE